MTKMTDPADQSESGAIQFDTSHPRPSGPILYSLLSRLRLALASPFTSRTVFQLWRQIEHQFALIRQAEAALAGVEIFERASISARMGVWQCELPSNRLTWSDGTYDLFGLQRRSEIVRSEILNFYSEGSPACLERARDHAIESGSGFGLDAEIRVPGLGTRWIRISATVDRRRTGEPVRLFGIKQDITDEKRRIEQIEYLARHDVMTGLANRSQFEARLAENCQFGRSAGGVLMLVDLDGFKDVNDTYGHAIGDECLVEAARRLSAICQSADLIARIGGDEFAVLFGPELSRQRIQDVAQRLIDAMVEPMACSGHIVRVGASVGYDFLEGNAPSVAFTKADRALYAAKSAGGCMHRGATLATSRRR